LLGEQVLAHAGAAEALRTVHTRDLKTLAAVEGIVTNLTIGHFLLLVSIGLIKAGYNLNYAIKNSNFTLLSINK
jgi:hypothetical protein